MLTISKVINEEVHNLFFTQESKKNNLSMRERYKYQKKNKQRLILK